MFTKDKILSQLNEMGLTDAVICLHSSYRAIGKVEGGPQTVIKAFLEACCTLVVPTFTYDSEAPPPPKSPYKQNGYNPNIVHIFGEQSFEPGSASISHLMGAVPAALIGYEGALRSEHPINSFAAVGPQAAEILAGQRLLNVYAPYKYIFNNLANSYIVMAGTALTSCTPIHFAEELAGIALFRRWAVLRGEVREIEVGSCSQGFENLSPTLEGLERRGTLGSAPVRVYQFRQFIETLASAIRKDPAIIHCSNSGCVQCEDKVKGGIILPRNC